jgi:hypothetical protein
MPLAQQLTFIEGCYSRQLYGDERASGLVLAISMCMILTIKIKAFEALPWH